MNCQKCGSPLKFDGSGEFTCGSWSPGVGKYQSIECGLRERLATITNERDTLQARVKRLEEAGDGLKAWLIDQQSAAVKFSVSKWNAAKESKP